MPLIRHDHWAERALHDFLVSETARPFVWGDHDCALFAANGIQVMTSVDIASDFRGKYSDESGAFAAIREVCGGETVADAAAWCAAKHGLREWKFPLMAQRGDLVVLEESGRLIAGLVHLSGRHIICAGEQHLHRLPIHMALRAWHVGDPTGSHLEARLHE